MLTKPSDQQLAWAAGFLDGEACFGLYMNGPRIEVSQSDLLPLVELCRIFGVGSIKPSAPHSNQKRTIAVWSVYGRNATTIALWVKPFLKGSKFQQAELICRWAALGGARAPEERQLLCDLSAQAKVTVDTFSQSWYDKETAGKQPRTRSRRQHAISKRNRS